MDDPIRTLNIDEDKPLKNATNAPDEAVQGLGDAGNREVLVEIPRLYKSYFVVIYPSRPLPPPRSPSGSKRSQQGNE